MYPLKFQNIYFEKIWGGRDLELFRDNMPEGNIGESWDIACHKNGISIVSNGEFQGIRLDQLINLKRDDLIGSKISCNWFPLLIKLISTKESLSVQVHPDDEYGMKVEGEMGKTEVWYVVEAFEGANVVVGTKEGCTKEQLREAIENGNLEPHMNKILVEKGDVYFVKSGLIHAIGQGVIIAEIQQNSDTTYRVYDYNRGRELHVDKALDVVDLSLIGKKSTGLKLDYDGFSKSYLCLCKEFALELYDVSTSVKDESDNERFYVFTCVEGSGKIKYEGGELDVDKGDSIMIPATLGEYELFGEMRLLKSYVPNIEKLEKEILINVVK